MPSEITRRDFIGLTAAGVGLGADAQDGAQGDWRRTHLLRACLAGPSREEIESMARVGANVIQCNLNAWVTEERGGAGMLGGDPVGDFVELTHRLGAKATGYLNTRLWPGLKDHPAWVARDHAGHSISGEENPSACQNSPYGNYLIRRMAEYSRRFPIDGWWLDCWTGPYQNCWCDACRRMFTEETGVEMPQAPDYEDLRFCRYVDWRDGAAARFFARMRRAVEEVRPGTHIWVNFASDPRNAPLPFSDGIFRAVDSPTAEAWLSFHQDYALSVPFSLARLRACAGEHESEVWMVPTSLQWDRTGTPDVEMMARIYATLTYGNVVQFPTAPGRDSQMKTAFDAIRARQRWLTDAEPVKWAAVVLSWRTPEFYGRGKAVERYYQEIMGVFRALSEEHLPFDLVTEEDAAAGRLAGYRVAVLPNAACLSDAALAALRSFVQGGGGLVATHETALYDPHGRKREDFALGDLFGARYRGHEEFDGWNSDRLWLEDHATSRDRIIEASKWGCITSTPREWLGSMDWAGRALNVDAASGTVVPARRNGKRGAKPTHPALVLSRRGRGRVAYYPLEAGSAYFHTGFPYLRRWLYRTLLWAGGGEPVIAVSGPLCLLATYRQQKEGRRVVVHLLNDLGGSGRRSRDARYQPIREEVIPLHEVRVICRLPGVKRALLQPGNVPLPMRAVGSGVEVTVPRVDLHALVELER